MKKLTVSGLLFSGAAALAACSGGPTTSTIQGTIDQASLPAPITRLTVLKSDGTARSVAVDRLGNFSVALDPGASYRLFLGADGKSIPVAVRSGQAALGARLTIRSAGATVNVGAVRYWGGEVQAPASTARPSLPFAPQHRDSGGVSSPASLGGATPYILTGLPAVPINPGSACVGGSLPSGQPCASQSAVVECGDEDGDHHHHHHHGKCEHRDGHDDGEHDGAGDGEHADAGHDGDQDDAGRSDDDVDTAAPFAVAGLEVPGEIKCDDDEHRHHGDDDSDHERHDD